MAETPGVDPRTTLAGQRTNLARLRVSLALDRTTLAWIRTTLTMTTFGFGMIGFYRTLEEKTGTSKSAQLHHGAIKFGVALVILGLIAMVVSAISHWSSLRKLQAGENLIVARWPLSITVAMLLSIIGLAGLWYALSP